MFPRLTTPVFAAVPPENNAPLFGPATPSSYAQKSGNVIDTEPRVVSNLIVDQTSTNPAAIAAAGFPVRTQGNPGVQVCTTDPDPLADPPVAAVPTDCTPSHETLFIPNVTTDVGLSPPYNSLFTLFGQFFDHGIDQTVKGGGTVFVPLKSDDPLIAGKDHIFGNADDLNPNLRFMVLTRGKNQPGPDGVLGTADDIQDALNTDSPWVDQSQTYTSHSSHQVFLREYEAAAGGPLATGRAARRHTAGRCPCRSGCWHRNLGGHQAPGRDRARPATGRQGRPGHPAARCRRLRQLHPRARPRAAAVRDGNRARRRRYRRRRIPVPANVLHFETPFLTDIANNAAPNSGPDSGRQHHGIR